ncbi:MAG: hypothetical protein ACK5Q5_10150 [Planctomycetaceae bacterium]
MRYFFELDIEDTLDMSRRLMRLSCPWLVLVAVGLLADEPATAPVAPAPPAVTELSDQIDATTDTGKAAVRLKFLQQAVNRFEVRVLGDVDAPSPCLMPPLLRYQNPLTSSKDGLLVAFSRGGRPDVLGTVCIGHAKGGAHEFYTTNGLPVELRRDGQLYWTSPVNEMKFQDLPDSPPPAATAALRSIQMRNIAGQISVMDDHGWTSKVRQPLRLLRQPVHRYVDESQQVIDGAVFSYVLGTDPEANLLLEAYSSKEGPRWRLTFIPQTVYALQDFRNEQMILEIQERRIFCTSNAEQYVCTFRAGPNDVSLEGMMPESKTPAPKPATPPAQP